MKLKQCRRCVDLASRNQRLLDELEKERMFGKVRQEVYDRTLAEFREVLELRRDQLLQASATEGRLGNALEDMRRQLSEARSSEARYEIAGLVARKRRKKRR